MFAFADRHPRKEETVQTGPGGMLEEVMAGLGGGRGDSGRICLPGFQCDKALFTLKLSRRNSASSLVIGCV